MKNFIVICCCVLINCSSGGKNAFFQNVNPYFPLDKRNKWTYSVDEYSLSVKVYDFVEIDNDLFAAIEENSTRSDEPPITRTLYYRFDDRGNVERILKDVEILRSNVGSSPNIPQNGRSVWYKLDAKIDESWFAFGNSVFNRKEIHQFKITLLSRSDTVIVKDERFTGCYKFYIDDLSESDSEYYDWLAKDVGLVKRSYGSNESKALRLSVFGKSH